MKKSPLRKTSSKRAKEMRQYRAEVKLWLSDHRMLCAVCRFNPPTQCRHRRGRIGRLLLDKRFWLPVCDKCHKDIHDDPQWARMNGLLAPASEFNVYPG